MSQEILKKKTIEKQTNQMKFGLIDIIKRANDWYWLFHSQNQYINNMH